jgi:hypothetical protein
VKLIFKPAILLLVLTAGSSMAARGAPRVMENIHGYTFAGDRLQTFTRLVFDLGKVVETGDSKALHRKYVDAGVEAGNPTGVLVSAISW